MAKLQRKPRIDTKSRKRKAVETLAGAALGAAIAGPVGALAGGLVASRADSGIEPARKRRATAKNRQPLMDDPLAHLWPKRVLVPLDFSPPSRNAMHFAVEWAAVFRAEVCLLHVMEPTVPAGEFSAIPLAAVQPDLPERIEAALRDLAAREIADAIPVRVLVRKGTAYDQITAAAREQEADLIIIASHGYTGLKRILLGSTAERVARHAPCPVLILRRKPMG